MRTKKLSVIVGLGVTGLSCAHFLSRQKQHFAVTDSNLNPSGLSAFLQSYPDTHTVTGHLSRELLNQADEIILSPGVSRKHPLILEQLNKQKPVINDIELFFQMNQKPVVAITGSNGKTTVSTLVGLMMQQAGIHVSVCGNIGRPVLSVLMDDQPDYYVLELSSFQLESVCSISSEAAVVLNISEDHMDRYDNLLAYQQTKQRIYRGCKQSIVNADQPDIYKTMPLSKPISFGVSNKADFSLCFRNGESYLSRYGEALIAVSALKLQTQHHIQNFLASLALCHATQVPTKASLSVLKHFSGMPHRCQWVRKYHGVDYYNDSKGTNVAATAVAIESLGRKMQGKMILIAGGQGKNAKFSPLRSLIKKHVKLLLLIGEDQCLLKIIFKDVVLIKEVDTIDKAVLLADHATSSGDIVLLSPACASFDMFSGFAERGEVFMRAVNTLP